MKILLRHLATLRARTPADAATVPADRAPRELWASVNHLAVRSVSPHRDRDDSAHRVLPPSAAQALLP